MGGKGNYPFFFFLVDFFLFYSWQQFTFWCLFLWGNIAVSLWQVCSCLSLGDALTFFTLWCFLIPGNVFLYYTLWTMCDSSLGVWKKHSVCLFVYFFCLIFYSCLFVLKILQKKKKKYVCFVVKFELNRSCGLHFIGLLKVLNISSCH
jgi:hypothetical protein